MYVIQKVPGQPGGLLNYGHNGYCNLYFVDKGEMSSPIATIADVQLAERVRDLLNQHGLEGVDLSDISSFQLPSAFADGDDD
jgi:hypothetical protein